MDRPSPINVMMLTANTDTSVTEVSSRVTTNAPRIATAPITSGHAAATRLPKMTRSSTSSTGMDSSSARWTSAALRLLASSRNGRTPPRSVRTPAPATSGSRTAR